MSRWVYWVSLTFIVMVIGWPLYGILLDPQADLRDLFRLGIDLEGGTSLIYELRPASEGAAPPDARAAKRVIMGRIDPQGTRGYAVRAIGQSRIEIVLPGRQTRVRTESEAVTSKILDAAKARAVRQGQTLVADQLTSASAEFLAGTRLKVRMRPPMYIDDIRNRLAQTVRQLKAEKRASVAVVGLDRADERWETADVLVAVAPDKPDDVAAWESLVATALGTQQDVMRVKRLVRQAGLLEFRIVVDKVKDRDKANFDRMVRLKEAGKPPDSP
ncbi:MAG TPA: hypothetical protein VM431_12720, partial [Phycisphaerae bacterium]|nr:hypothetical protein [Phycisphaerae bacterium]